MDKKEPILDKTNTVDSPNNNAKTSPLALFFIFLKGMGMGAADVVPGVSGGTIAFITGIYERLLNAIKSADITALNFCLVKELELHGNALMVLFW